MSSLLKDTNPVQQGKPSPRKHKDNREKATAFLNVSVPSAVPEQFTRIGAIALYQSKERDVALLNKLTDEQGNPDLGIIERMTAAMQVEFSLTEDQIGFGFGNAVELATDDQGYQNSKGAAAFINFSLPTGVPDKFARIGFIPLFQDKAKDKYLMSALSTPEGIPDPEAVDQMVQLLKIDLHIVDNTPPDFDF